VATWIKVRHELLDAPEVRRISRAVGQSRFETYGKLIAVWMWFDRHSTDGFIEGETLEGVDELVGEGFGAAMASVGWLKQDEGGIWVPNWDRHNSASAKERALDQARKKRSRASSGDEDNSPEKNRTKVRKPRDQRRGDENDLLLRGREVVEVWNEAAKQNPAKLRPFSGRTMPKDLAACLVIDGWQESAIAAIHLLPKCRFFDDPVPFGQLCSSKNGETFVDRVLEGKFSNPKRSGRGNAPGEAAVDFDKRHQEWERGAREQAERARKWVEERDRLRRDARGGE
jgi:hypothetical protein